MNLIIEHLLESMNVKKRIIEDPALIASINEAATIIAARMKNGKKLMLCGNGGSAADAQHISSEFVSVLDHSNSRPGLPSMALATDISFVTAHSNDYGFEEIFSRQLQALGHDGDVLIGISTSGNSKNIINAFNFSRGRGILTIGLLGGSGGEAATLVDIKIIIPSNKVQHIQESHITIGHIICALVEKEMGYGS